MPIEIIIAIRVICFIVLFIAGIVHYGVFCGEIMPTLERLGHEFHMATVTKYKVGMFTAVHEYKMYRRDNNLSLTSWWVYWISMGLVILAMACFMITLDF